ncbi:MAG: tetratricopeptide repeat protein [bacterium]|nr:tetratricopeptide repeat protein [bacterium]
MKKTKRSFLYIFFIFTFLVVGSEKSLNGEEKEVVAGINGGFLKVGGGYPVNLDASIGGMHFFKNRFGWGGSINAIIECLDPDTVYVPIGCLSLYGYFSPYSNIKTDPRIPRIDIAHYYASSLVYFYGGGSLASWGLYPLCDSLLTYTPFLDAGVGVSFSRAMDYIIADVCLGFKLGYVKGGTVGTIRSYPDIYYTALYCNVSIGIGEYDVPKTKYVSTTFKTPEIAVHILSAKDSIKIDSAIRKYTEAIRKNPNNAKAFYNRGNAYYQKGELYEAIYDYNKAISINPNYADAFKSRGLAYDEKGDFDKAVQDYNRVVEINPKDAKAREMQQKELGKQQEEVERQKEIERQQRVERQKEEERQQRAEKQQRAERQQEIERQKEEEKQKIEAERQKKEEERKEREMENMPCSSSQEAIEQWKQLRKYEDKYKGTVVKWRFKVEYFTSENPVGYLGNGYTVAVAPEYITYQASALCGRVSVVKEEDWIVVTGKFRFVSSDNVVVLNPIHVKNEGYK